MDDDPIREEESLFEKFRELGKKLFTKPPKHKDYFVSPYELAAQERLNRHFERISKNAAGYGITTREMMEGLVHFNSVLTPNEMRELIKK